MQKKKNLVCSSVILVNKLKLQLLVINAIYHRDEKVFLINYIQQKKAFY